MLKTIIIFVKVIKKGMFNMETILSVQSSDASSDASSNASSNYSCYDLCMMTTLAMLPQALQATLLFDSFLMEISDEGIRDTSRLIANPVIFFTAFAGKYVLLRTFNTEAFIDPVSFFSTHISEPVRDQKPWIKALYYLYQCLFTLPGTAVFVGLIPVSLNAAADVLEDEFGTRLFLDSWMVRFPFMTGAFLCNLLCFPAVLHYGGKKLVEDFKVLTSGGGSNDQNESPTSSLIEQSPAPSALQTIGELLLTAFMALGMKNFLQIPEVIVACFGQEDCADPFIEKDHWALTLIGVMSLFCMTLMARLNASDFVTACSAGHSPGIWIFTFLLTVLGGLANGFQQFQANDSSFSGFEGLPMILLACLSIFPMEAAPTIEDFGTKERENAERRVCRCPCT